MRPRNRRHVSVSMIGVRPISSSGIAQGLGLDRKGRAEFGVAVTRGSLCALEWAGSTIR